MKLEAGSHKPHHATARRCIETVAALARPCMVAIDGRSASGKSTLANAMVAALEGPATLIHGDDFYRVMDNDIRFQLSPADGYAQDFDWQRLRAEALEPLRAGTGAAYRRYDWHNNELGDAARSDAADVVIAEGVYMSRPELAGLFDLVVWVDTNPAERMGRQKARTDSMAWVDRWHRAEDHYVETYRPHESADLVVSGGR